MTLRDIRKIAGVALWFMVLTFPIVVIRVNTVADVVVWRWENALWIGAGTFIVGLVARFAMSRRAANRRGRKAELSESREQTEERQVESKDSSAALLLARAKGIVGQLRETWSRRDVKVVALGTLLLLAMVFPFVVSFYQINIMITALIYVMLALGLNIVIGLGGMLHLGYIAFYAVGAYTYAILNRAIGLGFWAALPIGGLLAMLAGVLLAMPVLRLRGDYLAIVTLGFAEIVRILLNNTVGFSGGPAGIGNIPRPGLFGIDLSLSQATTYTYFIVLVAVLLTIFVVYRFENSRLGRALVAMGEDDIAAEAMGINITRTKLIAFALGSLWAGLGGVIFASRTTFINPASFTVWQSVIVLCCVVLGGMGSISGAVIGALGLILIPEYLRAFSDYRMLIFGAILIIMMVFRPGGLIQKKRRAYTFPVEEQT